MGGIAGALDGHCGELQPCDPALRAALQDVDFDSAQVQVHRPAERQGLGVVEAQVGLADLAQPALHPEPPQMQERLHPGADGEPQPHAVT